MDISTQTFRIINGLWSSRSTDWLTPSPYLFGISILSHQWMGEDIEANLVRMDFSNKTHLVRMDDGS